MGGPSLRRRRSRSSAPKRFHAIVAKGSGSFLKKEPKNSRPFDAERTGLSASNGQSLFASFSSEKEESLS
jgi:hypothetical protein